MNKIDTQYILQIPAQLWIGNHGILEKQTHTMLQKLFCATKGCTACTTCKQITAHQYHTIHWLAPKKRYTLEQLDDIFETLSFALDHDQHHFFIIQHADYLSQSCSNKLLKSIEEPPPGYHFILLAERQDLIEQTIQSRCITRIFNNNQSTDNKNPLFSFFTASKLESAATFLQTLDHVDPHELESATLLDKILTYWTRYYTKSVQENKKQDINYAHHMITIFSTAMKKPPMSGSSKIFWKNLFLHAKH